MIDSDFNEENRLDFHVSSGIGMLRTFQAYQDTAQTDPANMTAYELTGTLNATMDPPADPDDDLSDNLTLTIQTPEDGLFSAEFSAALPDGVYWYSILSTPPGASAEIWAWGTYTVGFPG